MKVHQGVVAEGCWCLKMGAQQGKGIGRDIVEGPVNFFVVLVEHQCLVVVVLVLVVVVAPGVRLGLQRH